jgi:hypothetical protein
VEIRRGMTIDRWKPGKGNGTETGSGAEFGRVVWLCALRNYLCNAIWTPKSIAFFPKVCTLCSSRPAAFVSSLAILLLSSQSMNSGPITSMLN